MTVYQAIRDINLNGAPAYAYGATVPSAVVTQYRYDLLGLVQEVPPSVVVTLPGVSYASAGDVSYAVATQHTADNSVYVPQSRLTRRTFIPFGDSLPLGGATFGTAVSSTWQQGSTSWATWAAFLSKQNLLLTRNAGVGGDNSTQMLARVAADVVAFAPDMCIIGGPTNDVTQVIAPATTMANIAAIVALLRAAAIEPVLCSMTPNVAADAITRRRLSARLRDYAFRNGIRYVDFYAPVADVATTTYLAALTSDGTHPTQRGARILGQQIVDTLFGVGASLKPGVWTPGSNVDALNLCINGLFQLDTNADGIPDNWANAAGSGTGATRTIATDATVAGGKIATLTVASAASAYREGQTLTTGMVVGNRYAIVGRIKTSGVEAASGNWILQCSWQDAGGFAQSPIYYPLSAGVIIDVTDGYFYHETTMPTLATRMDIRFQIAAGGGVVGLAEVGVVDMTAAGITGLQPQV